MKKQSGNVAFYTALAALWMVLWVSAVGAVFFWSEFKDQPWDFSSEEIVTDNSAPLFETVAAGEICVTLDEAKTAILQAVPDVIFAELSPKTYLPRFDQLPPTSSSPPLMRLIAAEALSKTTVLLIGAMAGEGCQMFQATVRKDLHHKLLLLDEAI